MDSDLIKLVNKLQDTFSNLGGELDMPQLVVVGSQSAGKSSVLETIVGRDFLPRGQGIVTRRPLVLQLIHTPIPSEPSPNNSPYTEWAQFLHVDKRFTDFNEIRKEIEQETFRVAGQNKGVSKLPISLRIYSPDVLDLTLVDLPGLTKVRQWCPVLFHLFNECLDSGRDQPSDIERQIRNLVVDYISNPNSVILSVSAANVDLANSESLKLARTVDPQGRRTIGILTKLDLMDAGTNALDILTGRVYPLKLGFIGVVNRSQQDINAEKSMKDALDSETEYFRNHPAYRNISHKNGTKYLAKTLNQVRALYTRRSFLMKARLNTLMGQAQQELNSFGDAAVFGDKNQQGSLILRLMTQFARDFVSSIDGTNIDISTKELSGGARIYYIFNDIFGHALSSIEPTHNLDDQDIRTAIRNSTGPRPSLFVPEVAFDLLVKPQIKLLEAPSLRCVELVYEELVKICHNCTSVELQRFPRLHAQLIEVVSELLRERLSPTSEYTQSLIAIQAAYINTNHPAFVNGTINAQSTQYQRPSPASAEPMNGIASSADDEDETSSEDTNSTTSAAHGARSDNRSVSNTIHDRSRNTPTLPNAPTNSSTPTLNKKTPSVLRNQPHRPHSVSGSSSSARETFLNYFFGQNGPGPVSCHLIWIDGRTTQLDGNNAAYDMKSLGKHIEAISSETNHISAREEMETSLIRSLITSYFEIVRQSILDLVPKAIMHFLVNHTSQQVQNRLVASLYKPELFADMLNEDESLVAERARVKALLDAYKDAFKTLSDVNMKSI
ncbi:Dynamin central region-domain-containing protein [Armillaria luteobubalina]|uniref:Dynamin central region-domain-containing protein n=1 Tax=Armillaria luteobubalina TaxID=153913 RepID=A0AA39P6V7_9AGAR|nr:Dynamin central region-domain-containing protein [Armillaria luteobubalina]